MKVYLNTTLIDGTKRYLRTKLPHVKSSLRTEAIARGLGFNSNAALISAMKADYPYTYLTEKSSHDFLLKYDILSLPRTLSRSVIRASIEPIIRGNSFLTTHGIGVPDRHRISQTKYTAEVDKSRNEFFEDKYCDQFELALLFLQNSQKRKTINRLHSSYGLKHTAERISRKHDIRKDLGNYVSNGTLIAAALYEGFSIKKLSHGSPNVYLNISTKSVKLFNSDNLPNALTKADLALAAA